MQFARTTSDTVGGAVAHVDSSLGMIRLQPEGGLLALTWKEGDPDRALPAAILAARYGNRGCGRRRP